MDAVINSIFSLVVFPGLLFSSLLGLYISWIDRKVTARIQSRIGPPWYQGYMDFLKLIGKTTIVPRGSWKTGFLVAPLIGLAGVTLISMFVWRVNLNPASSFTGDLIVMLYLLILPPLSLIIGGSSSHSPFGAVGVSREMKMMLSYELPFLIAIATVIVKVRTILLGEVIIYQTVNGMMLENISCIPAFIVCLVCIQAKLGLLPFDISEAESEIIGGVIAEYSGVSLALYRLTHAILLVTLPVLMITLFMGGIRFNLTGILIAVLKYGLILAVIVVAKALHPRLRIGQATIFFWSILTPIAIVGLILSVAGI